MSSSSPSSSGSVRSSSSDSGSSSGDDRFPLRKEHSRTPTPTKEGSKELKSLKRKLDKMEEKLVVAETSEKKFKYNSNKDQFSVNAKVLKQLRAAKKATSSSSKARKKISKAVKILKKRNKLIRIADSAKAGWRAAELYESDDIASNPEDDRRIKRCDKKAMEELKDARDKSQKPSSSRGNSSNRPRFRNAPPRSTDRCFRCGDTDHHGQDCQKYRNPDNYRRDRRHYRS